jgi:uncharacterized membrane protein
MSHRVNALILVFVMALAPLVPLASAHPSIGLSTDSSHIILSPGEATNLTLTIHNNGSSIETYSVAVSGFGSTWEVIPADENVSNVIPTYSASTTIAIRLATSAVPSDSGSLTITVHEPDSNVSSDIEVTLSVQPIYLPAINANSAGDNGLVEMAPGDELNLSIAITNSGNVNDTILLSADQSPDITGFWANWTTGGGSNNSNNTGGNSTGGNSTGGNSTGGNSTGGNSTGGNSTGGNSTGGNSTGGNSTGGNSTGGNSTGEGSDSRSARSGTIPQGWLVRFVDDSMDTMNPAEVRYATLQVIIPSNQEPGYIGFDLFAASVFGNFSVSTTLVVNVTATHELSFSHTPGQTLLPGNNTTSTVEITSLSSADGDWTWQAMVDSGDCTVELSEYQSNIIKDSVYNLEVVITAGINTHVNDVCTIKIDATLDTDNTITEHYDFDVYLGQIWGLSMVLPTSIKLDVDESETFNVAITNLGTEEDTISLIGIDAEGVTFTNPEPVTLARGASQYVVMEVMIDSSIVGNISLDFTISSTNSGAGSVNSSGIFEVKEYAEMQISGPADNRIVIIPGQNSSIQFELSNDGTRDLELSASIIGLPNGISVVKGLEAISLAANESVNVELELLSTSGLQPNSDSFTITFDGGWVSADLTLELQITDRHEVLIDSSEDRIIASPLGNSNLTLQVTNLGTSTETFVANINNSQVSDWFTISVDVLSLTLDAGQSGTITISAREIASGAPVDGNDLLITVTSTADSMIYDSLSIDVIPQVADGMITIMSDDDKAAPGETIYGNVIITNMGTAIDSMQIDTLELDCNLDNVVVELAPSMSSNPIPWTCTIDENTNAGQYALTFRLTSSARSEMMVTASESYQVESTWNDEVIVFTLDSNTLTFDESVEQQTISLTICNQANTFVEGTLELIGKNEPQMDGVFYRAGETGINSTYSLASNGCQDFRLMLTPLNLDGFDAILVINSVSQVEGQTVRDESQEITANVAGPHLAPDGLNLGILELDNKNSLILLASGWAIALLLVTYIRYFRKPAQIEEEEEEEEVPLGPNEVRVDEYNKVTCCSCEARLGVPEGSEPPFRFTCPKCDTRIRVVE